MNHPPRMSATVYFTCAVFLCVRLVEIFVVKNYATAADHFREMPASSRGVTDGIVVPSGTAGTPDTI